MISTVPVTTGSSIPTEARKKPDEMGREDFTQLLLAQIKNQNPLEPMSSLEFVNQLTQFANLEQLMAMKTKLDGLDSLNSNLLEAQAMSHLGKEVVVSSYEARVVGGKSEDLEYELGAPADTVTVSVFDSNTGRLVYTKSEENVSAGNHSIGWNAKDSGGNLVSDGSYLLQVTWADGQNAPQALQTYLRGVVEAVSQNVQGEPLLKVGTRSVPISQIRQVAEVPNGQ